MGARWCLRGRGGEQAAASGCFQNHPAAGCGESVKGNAAASCPGAEPAAALRGAALVRGCFPGRTGWAKCGRAVWGLAHPTVRRQRAPSLLGKRGYRWLGFGQPKRWAGDEAGDEARCLLSRFLLGCREEAGLTLGASPCLVAPHEGIPSGCLPGASRSPESGALLQVRVLEFYGFRTSQPRGESLPAPASPSIR